MVAQVFAPVAVIVAAMSLKSDTSHVKVYVKRPKGTVFWGGAGLNGDYIQPIWQALTVAGVQHATVGLTNTFSRIVGPKVGSILDALRSGLIIRYEDRDEWTITSGMDNSSPQFNLIGYSYGSLLASQTANFYAKQGHIVDHLVLIGSPIDRHFLERLRSARMIKKVVVINLTEFGDPIFAGMDELDLVKAIPVLQAQEGRGKGEGHFYYSHILPESPKRWQSLAQTLVESGLK